MNKIFVTSDLHFSHVNLTGPKVSRWKDGYRDFDNTHYMNVVLHETLNKYVQEDDILYFLGDFAFGGEQNIAIHRDLINCKTIHVILGNHDHNLKKHPECFTSIQEELRIELEDYKLWMKHHPQPGYSGERTDTYHFFGHVHGKESSFAGGKSLDVGVDHAYKIFGEYRPFELHEAIKLIDEGFSYLK
jgi:calcineurin-like phosphoesterase family protein